MCICIGFSLVSSFRKVTRWTRGGPTAGNPSNPPHKQVLGFCFSGKVGDTPPPPQKKIQIRTVAQILYYLDIFTDFHEIR
jgi:hypothetical protein